MSLFDLFRPRKEVPDLRPELDQLKKRIDALDEEWSDYYDRFRRMLAKMAKREQRLPGNEVREDAPQEGVEEPQIGTMTPSQMRINAQILARRHAGRTNGGA